MSLAPRTPQYLGLVCDRATSQRLLDVHVVGTEALRLTLEVYGQGKAVLELDVEGVTHFCSMLAKGLAMLGAEGDAGCDAGPGQCD